MRKANQKNQRYASLAASADVLEAGLAGSVPTHPEETALQCELRMYIRSCVNSEISLPVARIKSG